MCSPTSSRPSELIASTTSCARVSRRRRAPCCETLLVPLFFRNEPVAKARGPEMLSLRLRRRKRVVTAVTGHGVDRRRDEVADSVRALSCNGVLGTGRTSVAAAGATCLPLSRTDHGISRVALGPETLRSPDSGTGESVLLSSSAQLLTASGNFRNHTAFSCVEYTSGERHLNETRLNSAAQLLNSSALQLANCQNS